MRLEGFKRGGIKAFNISKELVIDLEQYKYGIGIEQHKPWMEKLYHQKCTREEVLELAERWCEELLDDITQRVEGL